MPSVQVPFADQLPKPEDVVSGTYDFSEQMLANEQKFAEELLKATAPLLPEGIAIHAGKMTGSIPTWTRV